MLSFHQEVHQNKRKLGASLSRSQSMKNWKCLPLRRFTPLKRGCGGQSGVLWSKEGQRSDSDYNGHAAYLTDPKAVQHKMSRLLNMVAAYQNDYLKLQGGIVAY